MFSVTPSPFTNGQVLEFVESVISGHVSAGCNVPKDIMKLRESLKSKAAARSCSHAEYVSNPVAPPCLDEIPDASAIRAALKKTKQWVSALRSLLRAAEARDAAKPTVVRTAREVAAYFGVSPDTVRKDWRSRGMPGLAGAYDLVAISNWRKLHPPRSPRSE